MIAAGVAAIDVTPPAGLAMAGFAARTQPASGTHDRLTARALVVGDTALLVVDVIGLDRAFCARVRDAAPLPDGNIVIQAMHTHGGPSTMPGRLSPDPDPAYMQALQSACIEAIGRAVAGRRPATLSFAMAADPDIARNRRHADGPIDRALPVLRVDGADGAPMAVLVNYACHPVVLGADNTLWTADYPHFVRAAIERALPGATALFLTGCIGDLNTGHSAAASLSTSGQPGRDFPTAESYGARIATNALAASLTPLGVTASVRNADVSLGFERREPAPPGELAARWASEAETADPVRATLLRHWVRWAEAVAPRPLDPLPARVSVLDWGGMGLVGMPGEIFAATGLDLRERIGAGPLMLAGFCEDNPGYIPPAGEYAHGGYEVDEAHRYYGQPASFAPGCAETLADTAVALARQ